MHARTSTRLSAGLAAAAITFSGLTALAGPAQADDPAPQPSRTCTGQVQMLDGQSGASLGYLAFDGSRYYRAASDLASATTFRISVGAQQNLVNADTGATAPYVGLAAGPDTTLAAGSSSYIFATATTADQTTAPGATPGGSNFYGPVESAVWSVDPATGVLDATWVNPDGNPAPTHLFGYLANRPYLGASGDVAAFNARYSGTSAVTLRFVTNACLKPQAVTFGSTAPESAYVGRRYAADAASELGKDVTLGSDTPDVCSVDSGTYTFLKAGTCTVVATAPGDDVYAAGRATQTIAVKQVPTTITLAPGFDAYSGRATSLFATVGIPQDVPGDLPTGTVQFSLDGEDLGTPVPVEVVERFSGRARASSIDFARRAGEHDIAATFVPDDVVTYAGVSLAGTQGVAQSPTSTKVAVRPKQLTATVDGLSETTAPEGDVVFRVGEDEVGRAAVVDGVAVLDHVLAAGQGYSVSAEYLGDSETLGSSDSTLRNDPFLSAEETSAEPKSEAGWYRTPVTIDYTCESGGADLVGECPASDLVDQEGADQSVTRSISAVDGGISTVTSTVSVDRTAPKVALKGVTAGQRYFAKGPRATCVASDALSGLASCVVTTTRGRSGAETVTATATDEAGNVARTSTSYLVVAQAIGGATYVDGAWNVRRGTYHPVQTTSTSRPVYRLARSSTAKLATSESRSMVRTKDGTWAYAPLWNMPRTKTGIWYVGVQQGGRVVPIKVRLIG